MATAILRSHNCFGGERSSYPNLNPNRINRCRRRKRSPSDRNQRTNNRENLSSSPPSNGLVMGQVKILKRGEELKPRLFSNNGGLDLCSTNRLGPDPEVLQKQIRVPDLYAGPTSIVSSPAPSELPFPSALVRGRTNIKTRFNI